MGCTHRRNAILAQMLWVTFVRESDLMEFIIFCAFYLLEFRCFLYQFDHKYSVTFQINKYEMAVFSQSCCSFFFFHHFSFECFRIYEVFTLNFVCKIFYIFKMMRMAIYILRYELVPCNFLHFRDVSDNNLHTRSVSSHLSLADWLRIQCKFIIV